MPGAAGSEARQTRLRPVALADSRAASAAAMACVKVAVAGTSAMPAEAVEDGGMVYLADGKRVYPVAAPYMPSTTGYTRSLAVQPDARRGFAYIYSSTMLAFDLDTGQQPQILQPLYPTSARALLALPGRLLMTDSEWVVPLL